MTAPGIPPLTALAGLVARIAHIMEAGDDPAARSAAAASVDELRTLVSATEAAPEAATDAAPGFDLAQIGNALAIFSEWLRTPTPDLELRAAHAMAELQTALGPLVGWDPVREDAERRAQYRREARTALDNLFPDGLGVPSPFDKPKT